MTPPRETGGDRVLILASELAAVGGIQAVSRDVVRAVAGATPDVEVWSLLDADAALRDTIGDLNARGAAGSRVRFASWALTRAASARPPSLVIVLHTHLAPLAIPFALRGSRVVIVLYGTEVWRRLTRPERAAFSRATRLIAISQFTRTRFRECNPQVFAPIDVCRLSVIDDRPAHAVGPSTSRNALIVGRMAADERYKGHDLLIDIWPRVMTRVPGATLTMVGDGDDRERLMRRVHDARLGDAIRLTGLVSDEELRALYAACQVFVLPSRLEGFGLAYLEAMRAGKPCIGAKGAAAEVIKDGATGVLVDADQAQQVEDALVALLGDPVRADAMGRAGRARVSREFSADTFARRFLSLVELPVAGAPVPPARELAVPSR
jgi:phosphatidylinositol alpha-1,6-mannosyltransferase